MVHASSTTGAGAIAAQQAAIAQATRASGVIVRMTPEDFLLILEYHDEPLVVHADYRGVFKKYHQYLTSYRGLAFYVRNATPIELPAHAQIVTAQSIWIP